MGFKIHSCQMCYCEVSEMSRRNLHSPSACQMQTQCGLSFGLVAPGGTCLICTNTEGDIRVPCWLECQDSGRIQSAPIYLANIF